MNIEEIRTRIDEIDKIIMPLLAERFALAKAVGKEKKRLSLPVTDSVREKNILEKINKLGVEKDIENTLYNLYTEIFIFSKELEE